MLSVDSIIAMTPLQRKALVFARGYQEARQRNGQQGYELWRKDQDVRESSTFKTFSTVVTWIESKQWKISWNEEHWKGFIEFCFQNMKPSVPQPGQLKNNFLLAKYISSTAEQGFVSKNAEALQHLYAKVVRTEISKHASIMATLGLRNFA